MAQSLKARLDGNEREVLTDVENYGIWYAMDKWGIKDYISFRRYLETETGDPNLGHNPKIGSTNGNDLGEQIIQAMLSYISRTEAQRQEMTERIKSLEWQLKANEIRSRGKANLLLEYCKANE